MALKPSAPQPSVNAFSKWLKAILLVDDDPNILDTAKDILEDSGYQVGTAAAGGGAAAVRRHFLRSGSDRF